VWLGFVLVVVQDGRDPSTGSHANPPKGRFGSTTRVMTKRIQEDVILHVQMP